MARSNQEKRSKTGGLHLSLKDGDFIDVICDGNHLRIHFQGKNGKDEYQVSCVADPKFDIFSSRLGKGREELELTYDDEDFVPSVGNKFVHKGTEYLVLNRTIAEAGETWTTWKFLLSKV